MKSLITLVFLSFGVVCALQEIQNGLKCRDHDHSIKVTQDLLNNAVKCINECGATKCESISNNCDDLITRVLQNAFKLHNKTVTQHHGLSKQTNHTSLNDSILIYCVLSLYHHYHDSYNCTNFNASKVIYLNKDKNGFHRRLYIIKTYLKRILLLQRAKRSQNYHTLFECPLGFKAFHNECHCDPKLVSAMPLVRCINSELLRPPMTWIGCEKNCTQILYSRNCFIDYCLLTASYLQLNASIDVQCNYGRTGYICGRCQEGYDSVFGAKPKCKKCKNIWLLLILVFGVAGFLLVTMLFLLDLTVTKGLINGFVVYTNLVGMENVNIFPSNQRTFLLVLVDMSNLDLGIETCFYKGMTEFDKQWLQLVFPFYLVFIVGMIATASRYSVTVEKLTRKRVISVLATLLFLSYNKLLLTTTTVLFYYQPVYHLETNSYKLYWPVDTSITLFDTKFILYVCYFLW